MHSCAASGSKKSWVRTYWKKRNRKTLGPCLPFWGFWGRLYQKRNLSANPLEGCQVAAVSHRAVNSLGFERSFWSCEKHTSRSSKSHEIMMNDCWFKDWKQPSRLLCTPWSKLETIQQTKAKSSADIFIEASWMAGLSRRNSSVSPTESDLDHDITHFQRTQHPIQAAENVCISRMLEGLMACNQWIRTSVRNRQRGHTCNKKTTVYKNKP